MKENHTVHKAEEFMGIESNFKIYPFTDGTGCPISDVQEAHLHEFYVVHYVSAGSGSCVIDFETYDIIPGSLYFVSPGQLHLWNPENIVDGFVMVFTDDFLKSPEAPIHSAYELEFFNSVINSPMFMLSTDQKAELGSVMSSLCREFSSKKPGFETVLRSYFHILMVCLQRMFADRMQRPGARVENPMVREFKKLVSAHHSPQLRVQDYAERMNVSVSRLSAVIKEVTSMTPGQIVRNELINTAKRMLANSDKNVSEICYELKFEDPSYFGRFFKRETGFTPSVFREHVRGKYQQLV
ncbi:transcriptional regulator, AraC family [Maridesulfovibrio salexigens DSM 2638]|uniref:Transcriptional regulator, AraC family n=1 Tax=Maridesulfovibrio salexigens (strain ATCC 14822 / DSM 2638 / NCIMB 8403 / VKM B-1763) TaxID=526222 RepID=C6BWQ4_MARSD|nr:transcriptional regulator, AraC family [Maridesulfovibrio salexigens DSM 2638]